MHGICRVSRVARRTGWKPMEANLSPPRCRNHPWTNRKIQCGEHVETTPQGHHDVVLIFFWFNGYASFGQKVSVNQMREEEDLKWGWLWALRSPLHLACEQSSVELTRWGATWKLLIFVCLRPSCLWRTLVWHGVTTNEYHKMDYLSCEVCESSPPHF